MGILILGWLHSAMRVGGKIGDYMVQGRLEFPKKVIEYEDSGEDMIEQYVYDIDGIRIEKIFPERENKDKTIRQGYKIVEEVLRGELEICARVEFQENEKREYRWHVKYCDVDYIGDFDGVIDFIFSFGRTKVSKDRMKQAIGAVIGGLGSQIKTHNVYPSVGFFYNKDKDIVDCAKDKNTVFPITDSQVTYLNRFEGMAALADEQKQKDALIASADMILSMPKRNMLPALVVRAYNFVAPLGYVAKQTVLGVFPYLFLYGQKGCSKTHLGLTASTYIFGEMEPLTSDAIDSPFRLGMEFTATTNPRLVDDGEDIFKKNIGIFKAAATSTIATKRGNRDKTLDVYRSFCPFIFTSNSIPIPPEEDARGALMDRLLVLECFAGDDFGKEKYQKSLSFLVTNGTALGKVIYDELIEETKEGINKFVLEIMRIASLFQAKDSNVSLRRSYCLAYVVWGIKKYYSVLEKNNINTPIPFEKEETMIDEIHSVFQENAKVNELASLVNFMDFVFGTQQLKLEDRVKLGVYEGSPDKDTYLIITPNCIKKYKQQFNLQKPPYSDLKELCVDLKKIGLEDIKPTAHRDRDNNLHWGVKVSKAGFSRKLSEIAGCDYDASDLVKHKTQTTDVCQEY